MAAKKAKTAKVAKPKLPKILKPKTTKVKKPPTTQRFNGTNLPPLLPAKYFSRNNAEKWSGDRGRRFRKRKCARKRAPGIPSLPHNNRVYLGCLHSKFFSAEPFRKAYFADNPSGHLRGAS
jgi:hypothetical protein